MNLKFATRNNKRTYRVAVVVSRKVHKSAVVRNRIRRRLYEIVRQAEDDILPGTDLVFTVFSDQVAELETPKLAATTRELLKKASNQITQATKTSVSHAIVKREGK